MSSEAVFKMHCRKSQIPTGRSAAVASMPCTESAQIRKLKLNKKRQAIKNQSLGWYFTINFEKPCNILWFEWILWFCFSRACATWGRPTLTMPDSPVHEMSLSANIWRPQCWMWKQQSGCKKIQISKLKIFRPLYYYSIYLSYFTKVSETFEF